MSKRRWKRDRARVGTGSFSVGTMAILKADILGADDDAPDAAGCSTQVPEDAREYEPGLGNHPPRRLDAPAQFIEINTFLVRCRKMKTACAGIPLVVVPIIIPNLSEDTGR